jgi:hypothetical protein
MSDHPEVRLGCPHCGGTELETVETMTEFAAHLRGSGRPAVAVVGAGAKSQDLAQAVHARFAA